MVSELNRNDNYNLNNPDIFKMLLEGINSVFFLIDKDGIITYVSPALEQMTGYISSDVTGKHFNLFIFEDDLPIILKSSWTIFNDLFNSYEFRLLKKNGKPFYCRVYGNRLSIDNHFDYIAGFIINNTEKSLSENRNIYRLIADNISEIIWVMDKNFNISYISPSGEKIRGFTFDEQIKMKLHEHFTPESYKEIKQLIKNDFNIQKLSSKKISSLGPYTLEMTCKHGKAKWHEIILTIIRGKHKSDITFLGVARDATEKVNIERELKFSEEKFAKAFRYSPNIQILTRMNDCVTIDASDCCHEYTGFSKDDIIGKTASEIDCWINDEDRKGINKLLKNTGTVKNKEFEMKDKNGFVYKIRLSSETIYINNELHIISTLFNLSKVRKLEDIIIKMDEIQKERIGHELDYNLFNYLSGISILCRELKRKLDEKYSEESNLANNISVLIDDAASQIRGLTRGINNLLPCDDDIIELLESLAASTRKFTGINCIFSYGNVPRLIDKFTTRNIFLIAKEAVNSAIKLKCPANIMIALESDNNIIKLIVRDDGTPENNLRAEFSYIIIKHISDMINGSLVFDYSESHNSLIFTVNINELNDLKYLKNSYTEPVKKKRVLVVDDQPLIRQGLIKILNDSGKFDVCGEAENCTKLIKAVRKLNPDLLVCDFYLNSVYNIDLCRNISSINPSPSVLIISNQDELIYAERMIKTGACGYIMKNETPEKIIEALLTVLSGEIYVSKKFSSTVASKIRYSYSSQQDLIINTLSERELEVFMMIGKGIYSKEIADKLFISLKTVEAIRKRLRIKLKLSDSRSLVKLAVSWTNRQENE